MVVYSMVKVILEKICERCGKEFTSLHKRQLEQNYDAHLMYCKVKINKSKQEVKQ